VNFILQGLLVGDKPLSPGDDPNWDHNL